MQEFIFFFLFFVLDVLFLFYYYFFSAFVFSRGARLQVWQDCLFLSLCGCQPNQNQHKTMSSCMHHSVCAHKCGMLHLCAALARLLFAAIIVCRHFIIALCFSLQFLGFCEISAMSAEIYEIHTFRRSLTCNSIVCAPDCMPACHTRLSIHLRHKLPQQQSFI